MSACSRCGAGPISRSADGVCCVCLTQTQAPAPHGIPSVTAGRPRASAGSSLLLTIALVVALVVSLCGGV